VIEMTLEIAERATRAALNTPLTVSVVDEAGRLVLCARGDGTGFFSPDTSRGKAVAAAAFRRSTKEMSEAAKDHALFWHALSGLVPGQALPSIGGVPITLNGRFIGAIGCGGGTGEQDHQCAAAGAGAV
jgi:glc operon protein GlcG